MSLTTLPSIEPIERAAPRAPTLPAPIAAAPARLRALLGPETFQCPVGPWAGLVAPLPLTATVLLATQLAFWPAGALPWLADRVAEALWLVSAPFVLATLAQAAGRALSERVWRATEGRRHLDWSPHVWHYGVAFAVAALPLCALQGSTWVLDRWLELQVRVQALFGLAGHVGYDPHPLNLVTLAVFPLVLWQAGRLVGQIPPGRLLGLQRELGRLRGAVAWGPDAWGLAVGEAIDRWLADVATRDGEAPLAGERRRRMRQRWSALRRELHAALLTRTPDLERADAALEAYRRNGWAR